MNKTEIEAQNTINEIVKKFETLFEDYYTAHWNMCITGEKKWEKIYSDKKYEYCNFFSDNELYLKINSLRNSDLEDHNIRRQLDIIYYEMLENQIPDNLLKKIVEKSVNTDNKFNTFRATIDDKKITDNDIKYVLNNSLDTQERKKYWEASKQIGEEVASDIIELVKLRNESARSLGFKNFYEMRLCRYEYSEDEVFSLLDDLSKKCEKPFLKVKKIVDDLLAKKFDIKQSEIRPWHYNDLFSQSCSYVFDLDLNKYVENNDILNVAKNYYESIDLPVVDILKRSDLYDKKNKFQHGFCTDIDRKGDTRICVNLKNNFRWLKTLMHELGHAVYEINIDPSLPFLFRLYSHYFVTEGIAMYFDGMIYDYTWIEKSLRIKLDKKEQRALELMFCAEQLIFLQWVLVITNFERELYNNPDQNLNELWWKLVEKYQKIKCEGREGRQDWASKIHLTVAPAYYQNYIFGRVLAIQLRSHYLNSVQDKNEDYIFRNCGKHLVDNLFKYGSKYRWSDLIKKATGEELNTKYFVDQFDKI